MPFGVMAAYTRFMRKAQGYRAEVDEER